MTSPTDMPRLWLRSLDFAGPAASYGVGYRRLADPAGAQAALGLAFGRSGVSVIGVDMATFGDFGINFAGPPRKP
jgi:hypothetical protein